MSEIVELFLPVLGGPSDEDVKAAKAVLDAREAARIEQMQNALVRCRNFAMTGRGCNDFLRVGDLTYIQTHCYVEPHGCSGGDYWYASDGAFNCPTCGHRNRLYDSPEVEKLRKGFKCVVEEKKE